MRTEEKLPKKRKEHGSTGMDTYERETKQQQVQLYRSVWEFEPIFKGWLKPAARNKTKAFCHCCNVQMVSEILVLKARVGNVEETSKSKLDFEIQASLQRLSPKTHMCTA